ncbi:MIP/aquaporin family protein [Pseudogracilibacillus auburnensis]|uniref:Glycerol uptake facilitator protein n=1 Tax=Pseudogracilibacillus auburnensis TaxID=1494959 RepID=A0A2V3WA47_9BACI|nr:MIP/aquaporin family protein [Pseudogracilibacillus auburnensis]MBO1004081.1 aquaporin family protein [Pseudogracilibacillus auburnensis]PXW85629.1 glycerol uptake facilitator protein [Pseudogracilibacillus auburnensis]
MSEFMGELLGTMVLIIFGVGVVGGVLLKWSKAENAGWVVITFGWGLGVVMGVFVSGTASDAHINPAVTLAFASIGEFPWEKVPIYVAGQMLGAMIGAIVVFLNYLPHWRKTEDKAAKLAIFSTAPGTSNEVRKPLQNVVSEMIGTFVLLFALLFLVGPNNFSEGLAPLVIGLLIVVIGMSLGGATGYAINPARDLGPRIVHAILPIPGKGGSDWGYSWVPVIGPIIGGTYGALFYRAVFAAEFSIAFWIVTVIVVVIILAATFHELKDDSVQKKEVEEKVV